jgi:hypothetical protein
MISGGSNHNEIELNFKKNNENENEEVLGQGANSG